jgi:hypothetical protein
MRPILVSDVLALARILLNWPESGRAEIARVLIVQTQIADSYRQKVGQAHPTWGDGSIGSRARKALPNQEPDADCADHLAAIAIAAKSLQSALVRHNMT